MKVAIALRGNCVGDKKPIVTLSINSVEYYDGEIADTENFVFDFEPTNSNVLKIKHYNKSNNDTVVDDRGNIVSDLSVELLSIHIDEIEILDTVLYSMPYYVDWPKNIVQDYLNKNQQPPEYLDNNLYFGFNGVYVFEFSNNVAVEYYKQFWLDEAQAHKNQTQKDQTTEMFDRMGEQVAINENSDFTIYDLEKLVLGNH